MATSHITLAVGAAAAAAGQEGRKSERQEESRAPSESVGGHNLNLSSSGLYLVKSTNSSLKAPYGRSSTSKLQNYLVKYTNYKYVTAEGAEGFRFFDLLFSVDIRLGQHQLSAFRPTTCVPLFYVYV